MNLRKPRENSEDSTPEENEEEDDENRRRPHWNGRIFPEIAPVPSVGRGKPEVWRGKQKERSAFNEPERDAFRLSSPARRVLNSPRSISAIKNQRTIFFLSRVDQKAGTMGGACKMQQNFGQRGGK